LLSSCYPRFFSDESDNSRNKNKNGVFEKIAMIGAGKMGQAIMEPMIHKNVQPADRIVIYDVSIPTMQEVQKALGVTTADSLASAVQDADLVVLGVKPQNLTPAFFAELNRGNPKTDAICLSIIAGKPSTVFEQSGMEKIVRSMPNTPATIGQGMTVWSCTPNFNIEERKKIMQVLSCCGKSMYVDDESFIDMATSISGSGPAYIFMLMESMIDAGVHMGFPRDKATTLVYHTMLGSTLYAMESGEHPAILRNKVTSPSGTTASALYELENGRFRTVIKDAMWACYRRSLEMGNHDSNVGPGRHHTPEPRIILHTDTDEESGNESSPGGNNRIIITAENHMPNRNH
jgi:pyrroline-5-carboxylate reductase